MKQYLKYFHKNLVGEFDWKYYVNQHKDLLKAGIDTEKKAIEHYNKHGKAEGRKCREHAISLIVACKNRNDNLLRAIKSWLIVDDIAQYVIVDYNSGLPIKDDKRFKEILEDPRVCLKTVVGEKYFNLGLAYNIAADFAIGDIILKIDADYVNVDSSWLKMLPKQLDRSYITALWDMNHIHLSGFLMVYKKNFPYYREDLIGYGCDDDDIVDRMDHLRRIDWFDAANYIYHIPHDNDVRVSEYIVKEPHVSIAINKTLSDVGMLCDNDLNRFNYYFEKGDNFDLLKGFDFTDDIKIDRPSLDGIYCINLDSREDRWNLISSNDKVKRFKAIDYDEYSLEHMPCSYTLDVYFKINNNTKFCFYSNYALWNKMLDEDIDYVMIIQDDIMMGDLNKFIEVMPVEYRNYDIVNLSKRISKSDDCVMWHGAEAYILSQDGAKKLIKAVADNSLIANCKVFENADVKGYVDENCLPLLDICHRNNICAPVDVFIGLCCQNYASDDVRLSCYYYPYIGLNETSNNSNIQDCSYSNVIDDRSLLEECLNSLDFMFG